MTKIGVYLDWGVKRGWQRALQLMGDAMIDYCGVCEEYSLCGLFTEQSGVSAISPLFLAFIGFLAFAALNEGTGSGKRIHTKLGL